jgi:hypothetical protein
MCLAEEASMTDAVAIEQRDEAIVGALVAGRSVRAVQREFKIRLESEEPNKNGL